VLSLIVVVSMHVYARQVLMEKVSVGELLSVSKRVDRTNVQVGDTVGVTIIVQSYLDEDMKAVVTDHIPSTFVLLSPFTEFNEVRKIEGDDTVTVTWFLTLYPKERWTRSYDISPTTPSRRLSLALAAVDWNGTRYSSHEENALTIEERGWWSYLAAWVQNFVEQLALQSVIIILTFAGGIVFGRYFRRPKAHT